jgi:prepilin-type processing-associated H-X9-DG protein
VQTRDEFSEGRAERGIQTILGDPANSRPLALSSAGRLNALGQVKRRFCSRCSFRAGFTSFELLVVIAITAILAGLLLPTLSKAKARGQQIACLNNLRQLQDAWALYLGEHEGRLPENKSVGAGVLIAASTTNSWVAGNAQSSADLSLIRAGSLFPYTLGVEIYRCPSDRSTVHGTNVIRTRSFSMDCFLNGGTTERTGFPSGIVTHYAAIRPRPETVFVFLDENEQSIDDGMFLFDWDANTRWLNLPSDRHDQGANLSFADGHCERWKWLCPKIFENGGQNARSADDFQDLRRLQAAFPSPP